MKEPTLEEIIKARDRCAEVIAWHGEKYLPIFERLEKEISIRQEREKLLQRAVSIAQKIGTQNGTQNGTHLVVAFNRVSKYNQ